MSRNATWRLRRSTSVRTAKSVSNVPSLHVWSIVLSRQPCKGVCRCVRSFSSSQSDSVGSIAPFGTVKPPIFLSMRKTLFDTDAMAATFASSFSSRSCLLIAFASYASAALRFISAACLSLSSSLNRSFSFLSKIASAFACRSASIPFNFDFKVSLGSVDSVRASFCPRK